MWLNPNLDHEQQEQEVHAVMLKHCVMPRGNQATPDGDRL
jgi:hypothetical protein